MRLRSALLCISGLVVCANCLSARPGMQMMVANGHVIELSDLRQVTANADGRVESVFISPDGKCLVFLPSESRLRLASGSAAAGG